MHHRLVINDAGTAEVINICLNYGGDIANQIIGTKNTEAFYMSEYHELTTRLFNSDLGVNSSAVSTSIYKDISDLTGYSKDISSIMGEPTDSNSPNSMLNEMRKWSDSRMNAYQKNCQGENTKDLWVQFPEKCEPIYSYLRIGVNLNGQFNINISSCLVLSEWYDSYIASRLNNITSCNNTNPDFNSVSNAVIAYWDALTKLSSDNLSLTNRLIQELNLVNSKYSAAVLQTQSVVNDLKKRTSNSYQEIKKLVGDNALYDIFNCGYVSEDLYAVYANLKEEVAPMCALLAGLLIVVSLVNNISIIFQIVLIFKFIETRRKYTLVDQDAPQIVEDKI
jgi:hypothetical protein